MKVRVMEEYRDKITKALHKPGEELELDAARVEEINKSIKKGRKYMQFVEEMAESEA